MDEATIYGRADDDIVANGGIGDDTMNSGAGNDTLGGGAGNDLLNGGAGSDRLMGGSGDDTLVYILSENTGATDLYVGGFGRDTVRIELSSTQWQSLAVQQEISEYLQHLATVKTNAKTGEVSNGIASDFTFDFGGGTALTVSMMERLVLVVDGETVDPHAPYITSNGAGQTAAISIAENTTAVTTVVAFDIDAGTTLAYSIVGGADASKFTIDTSTGALAFLAAPSFEAPTDGGGNNIYDVQVQASDGTLTDTQSIAVTVTDVNEAPTAIQASASSLDENNAAGATVATLTASDPDGALSGFAGPFTYAFVSGAGDADNAAFTIVGDQLKINAPADYEAKASYSIRVQVTDNGGLTYVTTQAMTITDVNEAPTAGSDQNVSAAENVDDAAVLATIAGSDPDLGGGNDALNDFENVIYAITDGNAAGLFEINPAGEISLAAGQSLDYETATSHVLTVTITDGPGLSDTATVTISVTDVAEGDPNDFDAQATSSSQVTMTPASPGVGTIRGSSSDDVLYGGSGDDTMYGGAGNDTIYGGNGTDKLFGGSGDDTLRGEAGVDELYGGSGNDNIDAGGAADVVILGGLGDDTITGSAGADVISGGDGADTFKFVSLAGGFGADTITDFDASMDIIALLSAAFSALGGTLDAGEFRANAGGTAVDANDFILFDTSNGNLYYDSNGSVGGQRTLIATLTGVTTLDYTDFNVV